MLDENPNIKLSLLKNISIGGIYGKCSYHGQIDDKTGKPHGLGLVVSHGGEKITEGVFRKGYVNSPHIQISEMSATALLKTLDGFEYSINFNKNKFV